MIKKYGLFLMLFIMGNVLHAQCNGIDPFITANYTFDAKILALREVTYTAGHPEADNPFLLQSMIDENLRLLDAIYDERNNILEADQMFDYFRTHVNIEYQHGIPINTIIISADDSISTAWLTNFINTGTSGIPAFDNLIATYSFSYDGIFFSNNFRIKTSHEVLNLAALKDDFEAISEITYAEPYMDTLDGRFNYTGEDTLLYDNVGPFYGSAGVSACDIDKTSEDTIGFSLYGGDCFSGCQYSSSCSFTVDENCNVNFIGHGGNSFLLGANDFEIPNLAVYPNPVSTKLYLNNLPNTIEKIVVYNLLGKKVIVFQNDFNQLNFESLSTGVYFLSIINNDGKAKQLKIIKN